MNGWLGPWIRRIWILYWLLRASQFSSRIFNVKGLINCHIDKGKNVGQSLMNSFVMVLFFAASVGQFSVTSAIPSELRKRRAALCQELIWKEYLKE